MPDRSIIISKNIEMPKDLDHFLTLGMRTIRALETPNGVLASSGEEIYGCIFGRDSLVTALKLLYAYSQNGDKKFLELVRKILTGLINLQGREVNIESGEEPGKIIHEFRSENHERLTKATPPWYLYPDGAMRNFDSVDSTLLFLIAAFRYWQKSHDDEFITKNRPHIETAIEWVFDYGDKNGDGLIDYEKNPKRTSGGLVVQSWMDSSESVFHEDDVGVNFPIAPVEAQSYAYLALKLWTSYFSSRDQKKSQRLDKKADQLKDLFNRKYVWQVAIDEYIFAHAIDNTGRPLLSGRSSIGHILWACLNPSDDGRKDCVVRDEYIRPLVGRLLNPDLFEPEAGIRTLNNRSRLFDPASYHNGSIWPHDNSLIAEGMEKLGFLDEAAAIRKAIFMAYGHFGTPLELFVFQDGQYEDYRSEIGQIACRQQAWSAASMIADALALKKMQNPNAR